MARGRLGEKHGAGDAGGPYAGLPPAQEALCWNRGLVGRSNKESTGTHGTGARALHTDVSIIGYLTVDTLARKRNFVRPHSGHTGEFP